MRLLRLNAETDFDCMEFASCRKACIASELILANFWRGFKKSNLQSKDVNSNQLSQALFPWLIVRPLGLWIRAVFEQGHLYRIVWSPEAETICHPAEPWPLLTIPGKYARQRLQQAIWSMRMPAEIAGATRR